MLSNTSIIQDTFTKVDQGSDVHYCILQLNREIRFMPTNERDYVLENFYARISTDIENIKSFLELSNSKWVDLGTHKTIDDNWSSVPDELKIFRDIATQLSRLIKNKIYNLLSRTMSNNPSIDEMLDLHKNFTVAFNNHPIKELAIKDAAEAILDSSDLIDFWANVKNIERLGLVKIAKTSRMIPRRFFNIIENEDIKVRVIQFTMNDFINNHYISNVIKTATKLMNQDCSSIEGNDKKKVIEVLKRYPIIQLHITTYTKEVSKMLARIK